MDSYLFTEEFLQLSAEVRKLFDERKKKKDDMRAAYEKYLEEMKNLDSRAAQFEVKLDELKAGHTVKATSVDPHSVDALFKEE